MIAINLSVRFEKHMILQKRISFYRKFESFILLTVKSF